MNSMKMQNKYYTSKAIYNCFSRNLASCVANSLGVKFLSSGHMTLQKFADDVHL